MTTSGSKVCRCEKKAEKVRPGNQAGRALASGLVDMHDIGSGKNYYGQRDCLS